MKKYLFGLIAVALIVPSIAFAAWWNPLSWFNNWSFFSNSDTNTTALLEQRITELENKINSMTGTTTSATSTSVVIVATATPALTTSVVKKKVSTVSSGFTSGQIQVQASANVSTTVPPSTPAVVTDYSLYSTLPLDFSKNPPYYIGTRIRISGAIVDFLTVGDRGATSNYIEIAPTDAQTYPLPYVMLQIDPGNYQLAVTTLNTGDSVTAYGLITTSQSFSNPITTTAVSNLIPVVSLARLDKCSAISICTLSIGPQTIFPHILSTQQSNNNFVSISTMWQNSGMYSNKLLTTQGKVAQIIDSPAGGSALVLTQDPNQSSGYLSVEVDLAYLENNQIKVGSILQMTGTLLGLGSSEVANIENEYQFVNPTLYITGGTVTVSS